MNQVYSKKNTPRICEGFVFGDEKVVYSANFMTFAA